IPRRARQGSRSRLSSGGWRRPASARPAARWRRPPSALRCACGLRPAGELWSRRLAVLGEHAFRKIDALGQVVELLSQRVELLLELVHPLLRPTSQPVLRICPFRDAPLSQREIVAFSKFSRRDEDQIVEIPNPQAAKRAEHADRGARFVDVKAMQSKDAAKERQEQRDAARALGNLWLVRVLLRFVAVSVGKRHGSILPGPFRGGKQVTERGLELGKQKTKP